MQVRSQPISATDCNLTPPLSRRRKGSHESDYCLNIQKYNDDVINDMIGSPQS